ncbi:MAG TPA: CopG family transcriptional regulator [Dehalococcoidia bacterium]|nr:CopG family transcriptional regulator [Dehalococcoidia bacterium]
MKKTTIYLTPELKARLKGRSMRTKRSEAEVIREALDTYLKEDRPVPLSIGSASSKLDDGVNSSNIKAWIRENWPKDYWAKRERHQAELREAGNDVSKRPVRKEPAAPTKRRR